MGFAEEISNLRKRSNAYVANLDVHIGDVIEGNEKLLQLNKGQLKASKNAKGSPLIHKQTGSPNLSPAYAKRKNKSKPDIFDTGDTFKQMDLLYNENAKTWDITSYTDYTRYLVVNYDDLFGIKDSNKAKAITLPLLTQNWIKNVWK